MQSNWLVAILLLSIGLVNASCPETCSCGSSSLGFYVNCNFKYLGYIPDVPNNTYSV